MASKGSLPEADPTIPSNFKMEFFEDSNLEPPPDFVDEFEDTYAPLEEEVDYDYEEFYNSQMMAPFTLEEILHHCIEPTLSDGFRHVGKIIIWCIIFRILTQSCKIFLKIQILIYLHL